MRFNGIYISSKMKSSLDHSHPYCELCMNLEGKAINKYNGTEEEITIPDGVTSIGLSAFSGCTSLTSITIPDSVTSIVYSAFYGCSALTSVTFKLDENNVENSEMGEPILP